MSHYAPHTSATFEGYYNRFRLPSGASVCLIVSSVPKAKDRPFMISFTHVTRDGREWWQKNYWPKKWDVQRGAGDDYEIHWETGYFGYKADQVYWRLNTDEVRFSADQPSRGVPWRPDDPSSTPAGIIARLPLPIQWHVHTVEAKTEYSLEVDEINIADRDHSGTAMAHVEKNWAISFPSDYIWMQARNNDRGKGISMAGGSLIPGIQAYLVGYQGDAFVSFKPPTSTSILGMSLGLHSKIDSIKGVIDLEIVGWFTRLRVHGRCDPNTFFPFAAPLNTGHAPDYTVQSYASDITVEVFRRSWPWLEWTRVEKETFENGAMEFGGGFYKQGKK
ncbi:hypothetical protein I317_06716 [Kwoniella heveanensis CBS 569]|uniref:Uncharacterized protein n=1 Tax=Kwoniella heveanensis BCC8398 TaxID=1296120 RepID=A0A1B9GLW3_9TREE|nr:hypothetical protein I316_06384 [Kwoniella heveanensis BCC8398]OCF39498.1 hypothetical protein I317_06716 [Kwoniella heveanensis CBS 569]